MSVRFLRVVIFSDSVPYNRSIGFPGPVGGFDEIFFCVGGDFSITSVEWDGLV